MNDKYPQWLFVILQNDYGDNDNYWYDVDTSDEEFKEAYLKLKSLRRKYSDYNKWRDACAVYDDYIEVIIEHNGGEYAVQSMFKSDIIPEGWVPRPKLKNKKSNRAIVRTGVVMSRINTTDDDIHTVNEIANAENPINDKIRESIPDVLKKPKGSIRDMIKNALAQADAKNRIDAMHKTRSAFDVLSTYYREADEEDYDARHSTLDDMFDDAVTEMNLDESDDGWRYTDPDQFKKQGYEIAYTSIHKRSDLASMRVAEKIYRDNDLFVVDTSNMSKDKVRMYR